MTLPGTNDDRALANAQTLIGIGRFADAVTMLTSTLALNPYDSKAWCLLAQAKLGLNDFAGSADAAFRASTRNSRLRQRFMPLARVGTIVICERK